MTSITIHHCEQVLVNQRFYAMVVTDEILVECDLNVLNVMILIYALNVI